MVKKIIVLILIIFFSVILGLALFIYKSVTAPLNIQGSPIAFEIKKNEGTVVIAKRLEDQGIISSWWVFSIYAKSKKQNSKIQAGFYKVSPSQTMKDILHIFVYGKVAEFQITIPEGWSIKQIGQYLEQKNITQSPTFIEKTKDLEGYLFPDTYRIKSEVDLNEIISKMKENFEAKTKGLNLSRDQLILASIVEREAKFDQDRAKIAGVFTNRLAKNMELEADPTVQYAKGSWDKITGADLQIDSLYNTYKNKGLPPGPICNPGLKSIKAATNPEKTDYFYFFHLKDGTTIFSKTKEEHDQRKQQYQGQF